MAVLLTFAAGLSRAVEDELHEKIHVSQESLTIVNLTIHFLLQANEHGYILVPNFAQSQTPLSALRSLMSVSGVYAHVDSINLSEYSLASEV